MSKAKQIDMLYQTINNQNNTYAWTVGIFITIILTIIGFFAYFQWRLSESQIKKIKNETENDLVKQYHLDPDFESNFVEKYDVKMIAKNEALIRDLIHINRETKRTNAMTEGNNANALISMITAVSDDKKVSRLLLQIINNYIKEFADKSRTFPEYENNLKEMLEQVRLSEQKDSNNFYLISVKSSILFFMDPEHFRENIKKEPNIKFAEQNKEEQPK